MAAHRMCSFWIASIVEIMSALSLPIASAPGKLGLEKDARYEMLVSFRCE